MQRPSAVIVLAAVLALGAGCGPAAPKKPTKEEVTASLQAEAAAFKRDGEKIDPQLGVKATWTITALEVTEQKDNAETPDTLEVLYHFAKGEKGFDLIWSETDASTHGLEGKTQGILFQGTNASLFADYRTFQLFPEKGKEIELDG